MKRRSDPLLLLALFAGLAAFMTSITAADKSFLLQPDIAALQAGDVMIVPVNRHGAGVRLLFKTPGDDGGAAGTPVNRRVRQVDAAAPDIYLSLVTPW